MIELAFVSLMFIIVRLSLGSVLYITHLCTAAHFCADVWELRVESKFEPIAAGELKPDVTETQTWIGSVREPEPRQAWRSMCAWLNEPFL